MSELQTEHSGRKGRRPPFTTTGFPARPDARRFGWAVSLLGHLLVLLLILLTPRLFASITADMATDGAGGPGPAGGGGGGTGGTGGGREDRIQERLQFIRVAPDPAAAPEPEAEVPPRPEPVPPPESLPQPEPEVTPLAALLPTDGPAVITGVGSGGGTGTDGTTGTGPGSGGGIGSGIGTGRGSGVGPGTGGGDGEIHPPTPIQVFLPPVPAPDRIGKPYHGTAYFEVDEAGSARLISFTETRDRGYNRLLRERLEQMRFRPAVRADGTPVKQTYPLSFSIF